MVVTELRHLTPWPSAVAIDADGRDDNYYLEPVRAFNVLPVSGRGVSR